MFSDVQFVLCLLLFSSPNLLYSLLLPTSLGKCPIIHWDIRLNDIRPNSSSSYLQIYKTSIATLSALLLLAMEKNVPISIRDQPSISALDLFSFCLLRDFILPFIAMHCQFLPFLQICFSISHLKTKHMFLNSTSTLAVTPYHCFSSI